MLVSIQVSTFIPNVTAERVYRAWLDSSEHGAFTGGTAQIDPRRGGRYTTWDGYIEGVTLDLEPYCRILQTWRTTDFPEDSPDSRLEVLLEEIEGGTRLTLNHSDIPHDQGEDYRQGWEDHYFTPMQVYFAGRRE